jgi:hypothetical protein
MQPSTGVVMPPRPIDFRRKLLLWGTPIVLAHYAIVIWHVALLVKVQPGFPRLAILLLLSINLFPIAGLFAFGRGFPKLAGSMIIIPLGIALVIGGYTHFLSAGSDNVFRMVPSELRSPFQVSAVLLALLEALGCWIGFRIFAFSWTR